MLSLGFLRLTRDVYRAPPREQQAQENTPVTLLDEDSDEDPDEDPDVPLLQKTIMPEPVLNYLTAGGCAPLAVMPVL